jgi:hypothetical protein
MRVPLGQATMANEQDQARIIAERVARRLAVESKAPERSASATRNGAGSAAEQPRARMIDFVSSGPPVRSAPSIVQHSSVVEASEPISSEARAEFFQFVPATQSPWLGRLPAMLGQDNPQSAMLSAGSPAGQPGWGASPQSADHPSQERFGIEEATVAELVEFFENEKKCSVDPSGKPCDHCAMCSSRGF